MLIDTSFDFRTDTPVRKDPDAFSPTLCRYHKLLWSKVLPSGAFFNLEDSSSHGKYALHHRSHLGEFFLTSDSIIHSYTSWSKLKHITESFPEEQNEEFRRISYTIGGMLVFPGNRIDGKQTINGARGCHPMISDRFDLTLECIRRHYIGQHSPLEDTLKRYGDFFALFEDFRGYVEFFLLQDLVVDDYSRVTFLMPFDEFRTSPVPGDVDTYMEYRRLSIDFVEARNLRMDRYAVSYRGTGAIGQIQPTMRARMSTQATPNSEGGAAVVAAAVAPAPRSARTGMTEAQALEIAKKMYGDDAMVWITTHDKNGSPYKVPRHRIGYAPHPLETRFVEVGADGVRRRIKGVGSSWSGACESARGALDPRFVPPAPPPALGRSGITETQALEIARKMYGDDAMVWTTTHDRNGQPYKSPRRTGMTEPQEEKPFEKPKSRTYERLKCTPIILYPDSQDDREEIRAAAKADNRSVSNYILTLVLKHIRGGNDPW